MGHRPLWGFFKLLQESAVATLPYNVHFKCSQCSHFFLGVKEICFPSHIRPSEKLMEKAVCGQKVEKTIVRSIGKQQEKLLEENGRVAVSFVRG